VTVTWAELLAKAPANPAAALRGVVRVVADGTGRSPTEVWVLTAAAVTVTVALEVTREVKWLLGLVTRR
jgi:hypothetical protein